MNVPGGLSEVLYGLRISTNNHLTKTKLMLPVHRFVEYEPKDHGWLLRLGMAHYKTVPDECVYRIGDTLYMHPTTAERLVAALPQIGARS